MNQPPPDRLSNLPRLVLIDNILDGFDFPQLAVLLSVSRRFSECCLMVSIVNVDFSRTIEGRREHLALRLGRYLYRRRLQDFRGLSQLSLNRVCLGPSMVYSWVLDASYCNLEHLTLGIKPHFLGSDFALPSNCCEALKSLALNLQGGRFKIPKGVCPVLETLKLEMLVADGDLGDWLSTCCPRMQKVFMREVSGIISLSLSMESLRFLKFKKLKSNDLRQLSISSNNVQAIWINWIKSAVEGRRGLELNTPNLVFLGIQGTMPLFEHLVFGGRLTQVFIDLAKFWTDPDVPIWTNLNSLIGSVTSTRHLIIKGRLIQVLQDNRVNLCELICIPSVSVYVTSGADMEALRSILSRALTTGWRIPEHIVVSYMPRERVAPQARIAHSNQVRLLVEEIELVRVVFPDTVVVVQTLQSSSPGISFACTTFD